MIPVACCLIYNEDGNILLAQKPSGLWEFPGGKQGHNETLLQCAEREIEEELQVKIQAERELPCSHQVTGNEKQYNLILIECSWIAGEPLLSEHLSAQWFQPHELHSLPMCPGDRILWDKYFFKTITL